MRNGRLIELEATRGIAAIVVLGHHLLLGFFPHFHGLLFAGEWLSPFGTPLFAFINGSAAVVLFFVLSGFVLTVRSFQDNSFVPLVTGSLKRWPRLVVPVLTVNLLSGLLAGLALYTNRAAAAEIGSPWLGWFFGRPPDLWADVTAAAYEGVWLTFVRGDASFNSNLWTMSYEFAGSFIAFATAGLALILARWRWLVLSGASLATGLLGSAYLVCFPIGVALACLYSSPAWPSLVAWLGRRTYRFWLQTVAALVTLLGYHEAYGPAHLPIGIYAVLAPVSDFAPLPTRVLLHTLASVMILILVLGHPAVARPLAGPVGALLGQLSFPIYLVQIPVICWIGGGVFAALMPVIGRAPSLLLACGVSAVVTLVLALPLARLEACWLRGLRWCSAGGLAAANRLRAGGLARGRPAPS